MRRFMPSVTARHLLQGSWLLILFTRFIKPRRTFSTLSTTNGKETHPCGTNTSNSSINFIEFVTSPNNPDGMLKHSVLKGPSVKSIYDHAYFWPHFSVIPAQLMKIS